MTSRPLGACRRTRRVAGAAEQRVVRARRVVAAVTFIFAVGKKGFLLKRKEIRKRKWGTGSRKLLCFGIEDVDERKLYRGRRDACTYMRSTSGQPYALTAIFAWKERHSPSPVSIGVKLRA